MGDTLEDRIRTLEDRAAIQELGIRYGWVMDERDAEGTRALFAPDASIRSKDGKMDAQGLDTILTMYEGRWSVLGPTNHFSHGQLIEFGDDPDRATGLLFGHAEVVREGKAHQVALRYDDEYRRLDGRWVFASRVISYMYYAPIADLAEALESDGPVRVYGEAAPGDWPDALRSA